MGRLDNYEQVDARLKRVHAMSKNVRIHTDVIAHSENWERVTIKALLYEGETLIATGIAMDWKDKDRNANRTNWVEVAETSAVGRAIANSRFQDPNAERPSREEMEVAQGRSSKPKENKTHPLKTLCDKHNLTDELLNNFCMGGGRNWIRKGQHWSESPAEKLDGIYERAKQNPEGFVKAIGA